MANGFDPVNVLVRDQPAWISLEGGAFLLANYDPPADDVLGRGVQFDIKMFTITLSQIICIWSTSCASPFLVRHY